jgi:hypothetical protein
MPHSFSDLIDLWPSVEDFASDIGVPFHTARNWRARNSIPAYRWAAVVAAAKKRHLSVSADLLTRMAAA